jgi:hypothetical protein
LSDEIVLTTHRRASVQTETAPHQSFAEVAFPTTAGVCKGVACTVDTCAHEGLSCCRGNGGELRAIDFGAAASAAIAGEPVVVFIIIVVGVMTTVATNDAVALEEQPAEGPIVAEELVEILDGDYVEKVRYGPISLQMKGDIYE